MGSISLGHRTSSARSTNYDIKVANITGGFAEHAHRATDEILLVVAGRLFLTGQPEFDAKVTSKVRLALLGIYDESPPPQASRRPLAVWPEVPLCRRPAFGACRSAIERAFRRPGSGHSHLVQNRS